MNQNAMVVGFRWQGQDVTVAELPLSPELAMSTDGFLFMAFVCSRLAGQLPAEVKRQWQVLQQAQGAPPTQAAPDDTRGTQ